MFNNDSWKKYQEAIGLKVKALEELYIAESTQRLSKGLTLDKDQWVYSRANNMKALKKDFFQKAQVTAKEINKIVTEGLEYSIKQSSKGIVITKEVEEAQKRILISSIESTQAKVSKDLNLLLTIAIQDYRSTIAEVKLDSRDLYTQIKERVTKKSDLGYVVTQSGRKWTFKSYMEMSVRTEMQNNALNNLEASAKASGVEIYLASSHADCADDHVDFQGKYYLADGALWKDEYKKYNFHSKYKYLSEVKDLGFLTRPNCRHYVMPILTEQLGDKGLADELGMPKQRASKTKYKALEQQRYNERQIRKYKNRLNQDEIMLKNAPEINKTDLRAKIKKDKSLIRKWQSEQRGLIDKSGLKRDYARENPGIVVQDMGVRRSLKV